MTGGGTIVKRKLEQGRHGARHRFVILSAMHEHIIELDAATGSVAKYERKAVKKPFASFDPDRHISLDQAERIAVTAVGGGTVTEAELHHKKPDRFIYEIEIEMNGSESEVAIDAGTGRILEVETEYQQPRRQGPGPPRKPRP